jgi:hypothetical protein
MCEFLIEVPHAPDECREAGIVGTEAWTTFCGCGAGTHTTWTIARLAAEDEAWKLVPKLLRDTARVVRVERSPGATNKAVQATRR